MKYLIFTILVFSLIAGTAYAARFDFSGGQPAVMDDGQLNDLFEQTRYDFTNGQPTPVFDTTAVDETPTESTAGATLIINNGSAVINNGSLIIN